MPYRSEKQRAFMHAQKPQIAAKWDKKYGGKLKATKKKKKATKDSYTKGYLKSYGK